MDGRRYPLPFHRLRQHLTSDLPPDAPILALLLRGARVDVADPSGLVVMSLGLTGASAAPQEARRGCGR